MNLPPSRTAAAAAAMAAALVIAPGGALACACGCGVFDIGGGSIVPNDSNSGFTAWFRYSFMDQDQNWRGDSRASAAANDDKDLRTSFYTVGGEYMINRRWTVMAELPIYDRSFTSTDDGTIFGPAGSLYTAHIRDFGDLELTAIYTGFSPDLSTGVSLGVKLPTGADRSPLGPLGGEEFDRDSLPGTGSTDLTLGGYHVGKVIAGGALSYFVQARYQFAVSTRDGYRPGNEFDAAAGLAYNLGAAGPIAKITPTLQLLDSWRLRDSDPNADPPNTGYERVLIAPGVDARLNKRIDVYADVEFPIYQNLNAAPLGDGGTSGQLAAPILFKMQVNYSF